MCTDASTWAQENLQEGHGGAQEHEDEGGKGFVERGLLTSPESCANGGSRAELRRAISAAWGHQKEGNERGMVEGFKGFL